MTVSRQESITEGIGITDEVGVVDGIGVSFGREVSANDNLIDFLLLESGDFLVQEDGLSRFKLETMI